MSTKTANNPKLTKSYMSDRKTRIHRLPLKDFRIFTEWTDQRHEFSTQLTQLWGPVGLSHEVKNMMGAKCVSNDPVSIKCKWGRRNASVWVVKKGWDGQKATERHKLNYLAKKNRLVQWNVGSKHVMRMWDTVKEVLQCEKTGGLSQHTPGMSSPHANHNSLSPNVMEGRASLGMDGWSDRVKCIRKITDQWLCQQGKQKN